MTFAAPLALFGLVAAAVPLLLHLVQKREPPLREFPAVRYLEDATRDHKKRLRLRNLLLLIVRTSLIVALVLAAAGPVAERAVPFGVHEPSAMVLAIDNSASSAAVIDGESTLNTLVSVARNILNEATPADRIWLLLADGVARSGTVSEQLARLELVTTVPSRFELSTAIQQAQLLIEESGKPGEVVLITDAQKSAISPTESKVAVVVIRPSDPAPDNRSIDLLDPGAQPWGADGGRVDLAIATSDSSPVPIAMTVTGSPSRDLLVAPGVPTSERVRGISPGWHTVRASLPPDELRLDNERETAVRLAPPAATIWDRADRFLAAALDVLQADGRIVAGSEVSVGSLGSGPSVVVPPADPALIGALNRALEARGVMWRYGLAELSQIVSDSANLLPESIRIDKRITLESVGANTEVLVTAGGTPWIVRSGDVVLLGSRFDPEWTELPARAAFIPLLDALTTRSVWGAPDLPQVTVGAETFLPARATALLSSGSGITPVESGAPWIPPEPGVYWLMAGADTLGAVTVTIDSRESNLLRAADREIVAAWPNATIADLSNGAAAAFSSGGRGDLRPLLLFLALALVVAESFLAGRLSLR